MIILYILLGITLIVSFTCVYLLNRNNKVCAFRISLVGTDIYRNLPSYEKMLYNIKPLKLKYWIK
jgi:hypothetical protein